MAATYQFLSNPAKLPKQWQPRLHEWNPYHCSSPDVAQAGWRKWSAEHPDWYARRDSSQHPDWYNRRRDTVRRVDYKNIQWHYERPSKAPSRTHDDFVPYQPDVQMKDVIKPIPQNKSFQGARTYSQPFPQEIPTPKWGLHHPRHYEDPVRFDNFPPIRYN